MKYYNQLDSRTDQSPIPVRSAVKSATSHLVTRSSRHTVMSSHGELVTGQLVTGASRHSQLVTSEHITKPPVVIFFLHTGQIAPRNSAQHGRHTYGKRAISKSLTTAKLLNGTNARSKRTVNSSQHHQTLRSTRHTILRCDDLTV